MKKYCSIFLAIVILGLCGCNAKSADAPAPQSTKTEEIQYTIYYSSEEALRQRPANQDNANTEEPAITFEKANESKFDLLSRSEIDPDLDAAPSQTVTIDRNEITVNYQKSYSSALSQCSVDKLKENAFYDSYAINEAGINGTHIRIDFFRSSGKISKYMDFRAYETDGGNLTEEQAVEKANAELVSLYGEKILLRYTLENASISDNLIDIIYRHYICGYKTTEFIILSYNLQGQLASVSFPNPNLFASVEDQITLEAIQKAEPILQESIPDKLDTIGTMIVMDAECVAYLRINGYIYDDTGYRSYCEYYINLY